MSKNCINSKLHLFRLGPVSELALATYVRSELVLAACVLVRCMLWWFVVSVLAAQLAVGRAGCLLVTVQFVS